MPKSRPKCMPHQRPWNGQSQGTLKVWLFCFVDVRSSSRPLRLTQWIGLVPCSSHLIDLLKPRPGLTCTQKTSSTKVPVRIKTRRSGSRRKRRAESRRTYGWDCPDKTLNRILTGAFMTQSMSHLTLTHPKPVACWFPKCSACLLVTLRTAKGPAAHRELSSRTSPQLRTHQHRHHGAL